MFAAPVRFLLIPGAMLAAWLWNRQRLKDALEAGEIENGLTFENAPIRVSSGSTSPTAGRAPVERASRPPCRYSYRHCSKNAGQDAGVAT